MKKIIVLLAILVICKQPFAQNIKMMDKVRGVRYCEILVVRGGIGNLTATVYNTLGCNTCSDAQWRKLDAEKLKKELNARKVIMNGPRYFLMDKIGQSSTAPPATNFDGLEMKQRATLKISLVMAMKGKAKPYEEQAVQRATEYVFSKGSRVYQLITPEHTYIMQSYAQMFDPNLTEAALLNLQTRLHLPTGWQYKTQVLDADMVLKTVETGEAYVLRDDLENTYQRIK